MSDRKLTKLAEISGIVSALIAIISLLFIYFPKNEKFEKTNTIKSEEKDSVLNVKNTETQKNEISNKNVLDIENATCTILETPTFDGVFSANNLGSTISLRQSEKNKNQITDDAKWYADNHLELPLYKIPTIFSEKTNLPENIPLLVEYNRLKSIKNNTVSDLAIGDKVRIYVKKSFDKGTEPTYSNQVYTVESIRGKTITLDNNESKRRKDLLLVPSNTVGSNNKNIIKQATKRYQDELAMIRDDIDESNVLVGKRRR